MLDGEGAGEDMRASGCWQCSVSCLGGGYKGLQFTIIHQAVHLDCVYF